MLAAKVIKRAPYVYVLKDFKEATVRVHRHPFRETAVKDHKRGPNFSFVDDALRRHHKVRALRLLRLDVRAQANIALRVMERERVGYAAAACGDEGVEILYQSDFWWLDSITALRNYYRLYDRLTSRLEQWVDQLEAERYGDLLD